MCLCVFICVSLVLLPPVVNSVISVQVYIQSCIHAIKCCCERASMKIAYSPTVPILEGQSRFFVQNLLLSHFFFTLSYFLAIFLCAIGPINLIIWANSIEFLRMSQFWTKNFAFSEILSSFRF